MNAKLQRSVGVKKTSTGARRKSAGARRRKKSQTDALLLSWRARGPLVVSARAEVNMTQLSMENEIRFRTSTTGKVPVTKIVISVSTKPS